MHVRIYACAVYACLYICTFACIVSLDIYVYMYVRTFDDMNVHVKPLDDDDCAPSESPPASGCDNRKK